MVERADAVLAAIPLLVVGGLGAGRTVDYLETTVGVGGALAAVPFAALGVAGAVAVVGHAVVAGPPPGGHE